MRLNSQKWIVGLSAALGFSSVAMGAAADHLVNTSLAADHLKAFETALRYHQLYSVVLLTLSLFSLQRGHAPWLNRAMLSVLIGTLIFCGSLYLLCYTGVAEFGYATPLGGLLLMTGWICLIVFAFKLDSSQKP